MGIHSIPGCLTFQFHFLVKKDKSFCFPLLLSGGRSSSVYLPFITSSRYRLKEAPQSDANTHCTKFTSSPMPNTFVLFLFKVSCLVYNILLKYIKRNLKILGKLINTKEKTVTCSSRIHVVAAQEPLKPDDRPRSVCVTERNGCE